mgnify:CR=1 FL=1
MIWKQFFSIIAVLSLMLGSWKGYVALFEKGSDEPTQIFPCPVDSLPPADQAALEEGIPIRNQRDLQEIMEDYLS